jgi:tRNA-Thr(GGU) m(6)t(6)A37 methyltransferase TsaA
MIALGIHLSPIGYIHHGVPDSEVSRQRARLVAEVVLFERYADALLGIEDYSHLFVLFWMHKFEGTTPALHVHPRGRLDLPLTGLFSTRMGRRPNPIGLAVVELLGRAGGRLTVRRLDAYHGSPVIDLKPYDHDDVFPDILVPEWWLQLKRSGGSQSRDDDGGTAP